MVTGCGEPASSVTGLPVTDGRASATGRIRLERDAATGTLHGTGNLAAKTTSAKSACPSIQVSGEGAYDWVVNAVVASPETAIADIVVNMDSGPIDEQPDGFVADMCSTTFDGQLNTLENLFFGAHAGDFSSKGFRVVGWTPGDADAWTSGGLIAEAEWSGTFSQAGSACTEATTFRLYGVAVAVAPEASPEASGGTSSTASPDASASASRAAGSPAVALPSDPGAAGACGDPAGCPGAPTGPIAIVVILAAIAAVVAGTLWLRTRGPMPPAPVDAVPGATLDYDKLDYDKLPAVSEVLSYEKDPPDASSLAYDRPPGTETCPTNAGTETLSYDKHLGG
jgi:hypothetical protein